MSSVKMTTTWPRLGSQMGNTSVPSTMNAMLQSQKHESGLHEGKAESKQV
jgi:hypothetical protein